MLQAGSHFAHLKNKFVSFLGKGSWATHVITSGMSCIPLAEDVPVVSAASGQVNPLTVLGFLDTVDKKKHRGIVHTAGASALGRQLIRLCKLRNVPLISLVRKEEYVKLLKEEEGAEHVIVFREGWEQELKDLSAKLHIDCCFEAVGGEVFSKVFVAMPAQSTVYCYGCLSLDMKTTLPI